MNYNSSAIIHAVYKIIAKYLCLIILGLILLPFGGCKKLVEVDSPKSSVSGKNVYTNNTTASAVLTGIYSNMSAADITGSDLTSIGFLTGLSGDELKVYDGIGDARLSSYYQNKLVASELGYDIWGNIYPKIYIVNSAITGISNSTSLTPSVKQQLLGEAKFMRAFLYFYLVNLYGDIPLVTSTDYTINNILPRTPQSKVWEQIIQDCSEAKELLTSEYLDASLLKKTTDKVRPNKWAAGALLARSYLYTKNWKLAEEQATDVITNSGTELDSLSDVFLKNSHEAIWQLQPVVLSSNTQDGKVYVIPSTGPSIFNPVYLSNQLINSFEAGDSRKSLWIDSIIYSGATYYFPFKYKISTLGMSVTEFHTVLRLAELFLIRSEARAQQNNINGALDDLNKIRTRSSLKELHLDNISTILTAIYHETQVEFFTEWGQRWLNLKRTKTIDNVMEKVAPLKGSTWNSNWQLFPISSFEIISNNHLVQNPGY